MKKIILIMVIILMLTGIGCFFVWQKVSSFFVLPANSDSVIGQQEDQIQAMIDERRQQSLNSSDDTDPFGEDGIVKILFIGLDNRIGETAGHCDAIQLIEINKTNQKITVTAVPRGTYSPLPGTGHLPTDYYVSKSCEVGGLDYGVKQIEKILGQKADYLVFIGFSQAMGIFRELDLPAEETMQWLRMRQGYAIGEPQRAKNHSTFIKQMLVKFSPQLKSKTNLALGYLLFKLVHTDMTISQAFKLAEVMVQIDPANHPERITLLMRPAYEVQDIAYNPDTINEHVSSLLNPIAKAIPEGAYTGDSLEEAQQRLLDNINNGMTDPEFVNWAYSNYVWLQIEAATTREIAHYQIMERYVTLLTKDDEQNQVIADYIIEMEDLGKVDWALKGKDLLKVNATN